MPQPSASLFQQKWLGDPNAASIRRRGVSKSHRPGQIPRFLSFKAMVHRGSPTAAAWSAVDLPADWIGKRSAFIGICSWTRPHGFGRHLL